MPIAGMCPYFQREQKQKFTYCELARLKFPDPEARVKFFTATARIRKIFGTACSSR